MKKELKHKKARRKKTIPHENLLSNGMIGYTTTTHLGGNTISLYSDVYHTCCATTAVNFLMPTTKLPAICIRPLVDRLVRTGVIS